jgi:hypothetical protein
MPDKKNKKTTDKPAKASKQAKPVVKAAAPVKAGKAAPAAKTPVKAVAAKPAAKAPAPAKAAPAGKAVAPAKVAPSTKAVAPVKAVAKAAPIKAVVPVRPDINEKVQQLVSLSKKNGYVTVQNINEVIPDSATDPELIENIMNILDNLDIKLLDEDEVETYRKKVEDSEEEAARTVPADAPYDPFNVYLKQMGHKPLLTREQEVEISKRIEDAELRAQEFLFSCWLTLPLPARPRPQGPPQGRALRQGRHRQEGRVPRRLLQDAPEGHRGVHQAQGQARQGLAEIPRRNRRAQEGEDPRGLRQDREDPQGRLQGHPPQVLLQDEALRGMARAP